MRPKSNIERASNGSAKSRVESVQAKTMFGKPKVETASFLAAIVESSNDAIISKDLNGVITSWNRGAERIFGYKAFEAIGHPITILIPPERMNEEDAILRRIRRGERVEHFETVRRRKNGSNVDVSLTTSPILDANGTIIGASKIARDIGKEREAWERLRESEQRFHVTLTSIGDAVIATDKDGRVTFMNSVAEKLTGWNEKDAAGAPLESIFKILNEVTRQPVENPVALVLKTGAVVGLGNHTILVAKDGRERPIDDSAAPICGQSGDVTGVVLVFRDATKQRAAETTARKLTALVEYSEDAIYSADLDGIITDWNPAAERIFGYSKAEMIGRSVSFLIPEERADEELQILARIRHGERIEHYETVRQRKDGSRADISLTVSPLKDSPSNRLVGISKIARDITRHKKTETALHAAAARFHLVVEAAPNGIVMVDERGIITLVNSQMERLFGYDRTEMVGQPIETLLPERYRTDHPAWSRGFFNSPQARPMERGRDLFGRRKDGGEFPVEIGLNPARTSDGEFVLAEVIDITERKRMEQELARAYAKLEDHNRHLEALVAERTANLQQTIADLEAFSFTISHDLRSPLRSMQGFAHAVLTEYADKLDAQGREYLERISRSAVRLDKLILEVLTYSRIGRNELTIVPVDMDKLIEDVMHTYPAIRASGAQITIEHPLLPVLGSHASLVQCVSNLLANAVKFVPAGATTKVRVWTEKRGSTVRLNIQDNGIGIPRNSQSKIFEPFQRAHPQAGYDGTGMGLAIVRKAIQRMSGSVDVESQDGHGSTFWLELPSAG